ncbi:MAG: molybdopterin-guanine dinucleotide biosynthesis protein B [Coriobacteriia bacterium]|nr:molybdopterin-guanine dinucleotide biosynthesis protein B [Coriobacteriia bacterium]
MRGERAGGERDEACAVALPVVSVVGKSDSGKTTVMERLIGALSRRGWRVAAVKHHVHDFDIDVPGKDSWRHARAGAHVTMISAPDKFGLIRRVERERTLDELAEAAGDVDLLVTEGFRRAGHTRIEVSRHGRSDELICAPEELFALVTDNPGLRPAGVPVFGFGEAEALADLIEERFLPAGGPGREGR